MTLVAANEPAPARLFIAWQDPNDRGYHPVAVLRRKAGTARDVFAFRYLKAAAGLDGFTPFVAFPDLHVEYRSPELFSFFTNRVMSARRRPDYPEFLETIGLGADAAPMEILARLGARATDSIEVFPEPEIDEELGLLRTRFFVRGIRYIPGAEELIDGLAAGDRLVLVPEPLNPKNRWAVQVGTGGGSVIGWVPDYLAPPLHHAAGDVLDGVTVVVERVNPAGTPRQTRVLCRLEVGVPAGFVPFDGPEFMEIDAVAEAVA